MHGIRSFLVNNFKTFNGQHWFSFNDLNILTGPNNSGKSSFIQALKLFAEGLRSGDFPKLDLQQGKEYFGDYKNVINSEAKENRFGFGFILHHEELDKDFRVEYLFSDGKSEYSGSAIFYSLEIKDDDDVFIGIYDHDKIENTPFKSPHDHYDNISMVIGKINYKLAKKYFEKFSKINYNKLFEHFEHTFKEDEFFWFEVFEENEHDIYGTNYLYDKRKNDLIND